MRAASPSRPSGIAIFTTTPGINLMGDVLRDLLDPYQNVQGQRGDI